MRTIMKTLFVIISAFSLISASHAGEMTVTGNAQATYNITSGDSARNGKGIGVANELAFTATGEVDNGFTWKAQIELDPTDGVDAGITDTDAQSGSALNDDSRFELTMGDMGMLGIYVSEGGENNKYKASQNVVFEATDSGTTPGISYPSDMGAYNSIKYVTPELSFAGATIKASAAVGSSGGDAGEEGSSTYAAGDTDDPTGEQYGVYITYAGLSASANYFEAENATGAKDVQDDMGGGYALSYDIGNVGIGFSRTWDHPALTSIAATTPEYYETDLYSIGVKINDQLSVSFTDESSEASCMTACSTTTTVAGSSDVEARTVQAAYNLGGLTLGLSMADFDNVGYKAGDKTETVFSLKAAF